MIMMQRIHAHRAIKKVAKTILDDIDSDSEEDDNENYENTDSKYRRYKDEEEVRWLYTNKKIISIVVSHNQEMQSTCHNRKEINYFVIVKKRKIPVTIRGVPHRSGRDWYFDVKLGEMSYMTRAEHDGIRD